jgi:hypothetical protein
MEFGTLTAITDREESLASFRALEGRIQAGARVFPDHPVGWQGGSRRCTAYWLPEHNVWAVLEPTPPPNKNGPRHRFWNCFGMGDPAEQGILTNCHKGRSPRGMLNGSRPALAQQPSEFVTLSAHAAEQRLLQSNIGV